MFHVGFGHVKTLAIRNKLISKLCQLSGHAVAPAAYRILCVRFTSFVRQHDTSGSAVGATLDTGGWLTLSRPGLSPGKMRQAYLGAITSQLSGQVSGRSPLAKVRLELLVIGQPSSVVQSWPRTSFQEMREIRSSISQPLPGCRYTLLSLASDLSQNDAPPHGGTE